MPLSRGDEVGGAVDSPEEDAVTEPSDLEKALAVFFEKNPTAVYDSEGPGVVMPWNDPSVALFLDPDRAELLEALNSVFLPPRLSAIYHWDQRSFEFTWSAHKEDVSVEPVWPAGTSSSILQTRQSSADGTTQASD